VQCYSKFYSIKSISFINDNLNIFLKFWKMQIIILLIQTPFIMWLKKKVIHYTKMRPLQPHIWISLSYRTNQTTIYDYMTSWSIIRTHCIGHLVVCVLVVNIHMIMFCNYIIMVYMIIHKYIYIYTHLINKYYIIIYVNNIIQLSIIIIYIIDYLNSNIFLVIKSLLLLVVFSSYDILTCDIT
jgi:hypothetical protein